MRQWAIALALVVALAGGIALAEDTPTLEEVMARLQQMEKTVKAQDERIGAQNKRIGELEGELALSKTLTAPEAATRDDVKALIREELMARPAAGVPAWADGLNFSGGLILEYEAILDRRRAAGSREDRHHGGFQLDFGFTKAITEEVTMGFRLTSGENNRDPRIRYGEFGDGLTKESVWIDRAYIAYRPAAVEGLTILAGKIPNCLDVIGTNIVWDPDVSPEAICVEYRLALSEATELWGVGGYLIFMENDLDLGTPDRRDIDGFIVQAGAKSAAIEGLDLLGYATYYEFTDVDEIGPAAGLIGDYDMVTLSGQVGFKVGETPIALFGETVCNVKDRGADGQDFGWEVGVRVNKLKQRHDWALMCNYAEVEQHAVPWPTGDFDKGGSNYRGTTTEVSYRLFDNTTLYGRIFCMDRIRRIPGAMGTDNLVGQVDLEVKF